MTIVKHIKEEATMNIVMIVCTVLIICLFIAFFRKDGYSKVLSTMISVLFGIFEIAFAFYHPLLWGIHAGTVVLTYVYYYFAKRGLHGIWNKEFPFLIFFYSFVTVASFSFLLGVIESIFGRFF